MMSMHALSLCETGQSAALNPLNGSVAGPSNPRNAKWRAFCAHAQVTKAGGIFTAGRVTLVKWMEDYDKRAVLAWHLSGTPLGRLHDGDEAACGVQLRMWVLLAASTVCQFNALTDTAAILLSR